ncbi:hypothetical protein THAOC_19082, partial [Thalassiosira oceanica]
MTDNFEDAAPHPHKSKVVRLLQVYSRGGLDGMSRKRPAEEVVDFDLDGPGAAASSPSSGDNDGRRRRVGAAGAGWGLAEVLAECGLDPGPGDEDD